MTAPLPPPSPSSAPPPRGDSVPLLFGMTSLFADMTYEMAHVLLPALMLHLGGTGMATALMESLAEGTRMGGFLFSGRLGGVPRREILLVRGGYGLTVLSTVLMGAAGSAGALIALKSLSWFGKGLRGPARDALLSNALPPELLARAFGTVQSLDQVGGITGPLLALALAGFLSPAHLLFLGALPGVLCLAFSVLATRRAAAEQRKTQDGHASAPGLFSSSVRGHLIRPDIRIYFLGGTLLRAGMLPATLLMFRFASEGGSFPVTVVGFLLASLLTVLANLGIVRKILPQSPRPLMGIAAFLIASSALLLARGGAHPAAYLLAMTAWGAGEACAMVGLKVRGAALWPPELRSRGFALFEISAALLSLLLWPLLAHLWDRGETAFGMGVAALAAAAGGGLLLLEKGKAERSSGGRG
ncbi:MAG: MFS transporter [Nitrospirae bacterium]|nr:MFS transporter [Nitrospirota bacterium]